jgi:hypothetical protein
MKKDKKLVKTPNLTLDKTLDDMFKVPAIVKKATEMNEALKKAKRRNHELI